MINPLKFISSVPYENRSELTLYFPRAVQTMNFNKKKAPVANEVKPAGKKKKNKKSEAPTNDEKPGITMPVVDALKQPVLLEKKLEELGGIEIKNNEEQVKVSLNARLIIHQLTKGPVDDLQHTRFIKDRDLFRNIWMKGQNLYLNIDFNIWNDYSEAEKALIRLCVEKSLKANLSSLGQIVWEVS